MILHFSFTYPQELVTEAEKNMESVEPPLFLRFINLLINDAIFLLDEALSVCVISKFKSFNFQGLLCLLKCYVLNSI